MVFWFLVLITVLVFVHELGHYLVARWNGVKVEVFSIGFGKEIFGFYDKHGTRWKFSLIPLGGYVKFFGDIDISSTQINKESSDLNKEEFDQAFHNKTLLQKSAVLFAGPFANFLFAVLIFFFLFISFGIPQHNRDIIVFEVLDQSSASLKGLKAGDEVVEIEGKKILNSLDLVNIVKNSPNEDLSFLIKRDGEYLNLSIIPDSSISKDNQGKETIIGRIGIKINEKINTSYEKVNVVKSLKTSILKTVEITILILDSLKGIVVGDVSYKELGGPIRIADVSSQAAQTGVVNFLWIMALISINLGLINLLPIPILDGGHLLFFLVQAIIRKPLNETIIKYATSFGMVFLIGIMFLVFYNDISYYWQDIKTFIVR